MQEQNLIPFEGKPIRKIWHNEEWYFSVVDVIEVLTESSVNSTQLLVCFKKTRN